MGIGASLIILLIPIFGAPEFWQTLQQVHLPLVIAALGLSAASVISKAWRWGVVLAWQGVEVSPQYLISGYFISMFFNNFLPSGMGGDVVRAYESARDTGRGAESVTAVLIERGSGMLTVFGAGSVGALIVAVPPGVALLAHGLFWGGLIGVLMLWSTRVGRALEWLGARLPVRLQGLWGKGLRVIAAFRRTRREYRLLITVGLQSLVTLALTLASVYALMLAFDEPIPFGAFAAAFAIITAVDVIPFSLNGIGVRESSYVFFLGLSGARVEVALGVALLVRLLVLIQALGGGVLFLYKSWQKTP